MQEDDVLIERRGYVQWITINRDARRNAINKAVIAGILRGINEATADHAARAIVLTGAGNKAFCAGGDLSPSAQGAPFDSDPANPKNFVVDLFKAIQDCRLPIIARVNGHALAGGLGLLSACDIAVATRDATFGVPESKIGIFPMMIMPHLMRVLPPKLLMELCFTGDPLTAEQALQAGLVNYIVPTDELDAKVEWLVNRVVNSSPTAIRLGKQGYHAMRDMGLRESLEYAQVMLHAMAQTKDSIEGFAAFREKRKANWTGQ
jgi:enoyl-CoA hydratase/carnithine racemase